jgi:hypothetical protein
MLPLPTLINLNANPHLHSNPNPSVALLSGGDAFGQLGGDSLRAGTYVVREDTQLVVVPNSNFGGSLNILNFNPELVKRALSKPKGERSKQDVDLLMMEFAETKLMKKFEREEARRILCQELQLLTFQKKQVVCRQGEVSDTAIFIYSGGMDIFVDFGNSDDDDSDDENEAPSAGEVQSSRRPSMRRTSVRH